MLGQKNLTLSVLESLEARQLYSAHGLSAHARASTPTIDFLSLTGFNESGGEWNYNVTAKSSRASANGTATTSTEQDTPTSWDWDANINTTDGEAIDEDLTWEQTSGGVNLDSISETTNGGYVNATINLDDLQVCGPTLSKKFTSSSPIEIDATGTPELDGAAKVTTTVLGTKSITVPAGTFSATEISLVISYSAKGSSDDGDVDALDNGDVNVSAHGTDKETFYAVNGVGLVKVVSSAAESETAGHRTANINETITTDLTS